MNYYSVLDAGMAWETSQFGDLSRDESVFFPCSSSLYVTDTIEDSVQRIQRGCMFIVGFVLEFPNLRKTFMSYDKHPRNSKLYKNRSVFYYHYNF